VPDFLLTYLVHPGTALYIGYNNSFSNLRLTRRPLPQFCSSVRRPHDRPPFFIKLSIFFATELSALALNLYGNAHRLEFAFFLPKFSR